MIQNKYRSVFVKHLLLTPQNQKVIDLKNYIQAYVIIPILLKIFAWISYFKLIYFSNFNIKDIFAKIFC